MATKNSEQKARENVERWPGWVVSDCKRTQQQDGNPSSPAGCDEPLKQEEEKTGKPSQPERPRSVSERKLQANRANSRKSTGPRTPWGKECSRKNALRHGLLSRAVLFRADGTPIDKESHSFWDGLQESYGTHDVGNKALLQSVVVEWSRQRKAIELEKDRLQNVLDDTHSTASLPNLVRYRTTSRQALLRNLEQLRKRVPAIQLAGEVESGSENEDANPSLSSTNDPGKADGWQAGRAELRSSKPSTESSLSDADTT